MKEENIRIEDMIHALKSRWMLITIIALLLTTISAGVSFFLIKPKYEANTKLFIGKEDNSEQAYNSNDVQMYQKLIKTYSDVIKTKDLVGRSLERINSDADVGDVLGALTVTPKTDTQLLEISYKSTDKEFARDIVQAITDEFVETSGDLISNANVKVVESVSLPQNPVSPNKKLNIGIAFIFGIILGCIISLALELMDNTFKDKEQIEYLFDVPVIGTIPNTDTTK